MTNQLLENAEQDASNKPVSNAKKRAPAFTITALEPRILRSATAIETVEIEQPIEGSPVDLNGLDHDAHQGASGDDVMHGGDADDWMNGQGGDDVLHGGKGDDLLYGGTGDDQLFAGDGDDVLHGGAGKDELHGGSGHDVASYLGSKQGVKVNLATGQGSGGDARGDELTGIEEVHGSNRRDTLIGDARDNALFGHAGNDRLTGGGGDDLLVGGDGTDTARFSGKASDYEIEHLGDNRFTVRDLRGKDGTDTVESVEAFRFSDGTVAADQFVNHAPTDLTLAGSKVAENAAEGAHVGQVTVKDVDVGDSHTFTLLNDAGGRFTINETTGEIHVAEGADLNYEAAKSHTIDVQVKDEDGATYHEKFTIDVTDVNEASYDMTLKGGAVNENAGAGTVVGTVSTKDPDSGEKLTYSLTDDADGRFTIDAKSGQIKVAKGADLDFESDADHTVSVRVKDSAGHTYEESFAIQVKNVNEKPTDLTLDGGKVSENAAAGTVVGKVAGSDPDAGDKLSYSLTNSAGGKFAIDAKTGEITVAKNAKLDFEAGDSQTITVRVKDAGGKFYDESFKIAVTNVNEAPTDLTLKGTTVNENAAAGTVVGQLSVKDVDRPDAHTYSLTNDAGGRFTVDAKTGEIKVADGAKLDYETGSSHSVTVQVKDAGGLTYTESFKIGVKNMNEAPTDLTLKGGTVNENAKAGAVVGTVSAKDADKGEKFTYSLADDAEGRFTIDAKTGQIKVANGANLDFESDSDHTVKVQVKDSAGNTYSEDFTIQVKNVNEAPTDLTLDGGKVDEHATPGTVVGKVTGVDPDAGDKLTYSLTNSAGGNFSINSKTGEITVAKGARFDYEPGDEPTVTVRVKDAGGKFYDESFKIQITGDGDDNRPPTDLTLTGDTVNENAAIGTVVGRATAADPDPGETFTYALSDDAGGRFTIDAATGEVRVASGGLDFEANASHQLGVQVTDSAGNTYQETLEIRVSDVNEAPNDLTLAGDSVDENAAAGVVVGRATAADPDQGETFTYALTDDAGGRFTIDAATGEVRVAGGADLNFEAQSEHAVTVRVTDSAGNSFSESLAIHVRDVNEAPTGLSLNVGSVDENSAPGTVVGKATALDPDQGDSITYSLVDNAQGRFTIDPNTGDILVAEPTEEVINYEDNTRHQITVRATDAAGNVVEQTVAIQVNNVNEWVNSVDDFAEGVEDQPIVTPNVLENDYDIDGDTITVSDFGSPRHGVVVYNGDGTFTYTPNANFSGSDSFTYTVTDGNGMFSTSTVHIQVHGVADVATLEVADATLYAGQSAPLSITAALGDLDGSEAMTVRIENVPAGAALSAGSYQGNGVWTLSPADLEGLRISLPQDVPGEVTLKVTLLTTEADGDQVAISRDLALHVSGFQLEDNLDQLAAEAPANESESAPQAPTDPLAERPEWQMPAAVSQVDPGAAELVFSDPQFGRPGDEAAWSDAPSQLVGQVHSAHHAGSDIHHAGDPGTAPPDSPEYETSHEASHQAPFHQTAGWLQQLGDRFSWIWGMFWAYGGARGAQSGDVDQRNSTGR